MPKIIFACNSNSCRSQMAEGWAHDWIKRKKDTLMLQQYNDSSQEIIINNKLSLINNTIILSVALDSSAVFIQDRHEQHVRKSVKSKAVLAMAQDGVDISEYIPKTIDEILPLLHNNDDVIEDHDEHMEEKCSSIQDSTDEVLFTINSEATLSTNNKNYTRFRKNKPVDKLIVLCSCGDELKYNLVRQSKSVEEWLIDPPTAAAKGGEGDEAYRRVSLEISKEVNILMDNLLGI